jgi:hypothetical protein
VNPTRPAAALPNVSVEQLVSALAKAIAQEIDDDASAASSPSWLRKSEAISYSRMPKGTFEKLSASGRIRSHGGKTKLYHRVELDEDLRAL